MEVLRCDSGVCDWLRAQRALPDKHFLAWEKKHCCLLPSGGERQQLQATDLLQIDPLASALPPCFPTPPDSLPLVAAGVYRR